jgi:alpha-L-fucosidase
LNIPPDTRGLIHEIDAQRLLELRKYLDETFSTDLACGSRKLWKASEGSSMILDVTPGSTFNTFMIREDISKGQRVEGFTLEAWKYGQWEKIAEGTTVGYRRLLRFPDLQTSKVRVTITATRLSALISEMGLYHAPEVSSYLRVKKIGNMDPSSCKAVTEGSEAAFDGDLTTEWKAEGLIPLVIDMGKTAAISGFVYAPADDEDLEGTIFRYDFAVSEDGHNWETVISDGEFSNIMHNPVPFTVKLEHEVKARYIRLTPREEISGDKRTAVGEMGIILFW